MGATRQTFKEIRQALGHLLSEFSPYAFATGTATGGALTYLEDEKLKRVPNDPNLFKGGQIHIVDGTGAGQGRYISAFAQSTGRVTPQPDWTTAPDNTSEYEIYYKFNKEQIENAIKLALMDASHDALVADMSVWAIKEDDRQEYDLPTSLSWVSGIDYVTVDPDIYFLPQRNSYVTFTGVTPVTSVRQDFKGTGVGIRYVGVHLQKHGSPTGNMTISISDNNGFTVKSVTLDSSLVDTQPRLHLVEFSDTTTPLTDGTTYRLVVARPGSGFDSNNYVSMWGSTTAYPNGSAYTNTGSGDVVSVKPASFRFILYTDNHDWSEVPPKGWGLLRGTTNRVRLKDNIEGLWEWNNPISEGWLMRIRGYRPPNIPSADSDEVEAFAAYVIFRAAALLYEGKAKSPSVDTQAYERQANLYHNLAEKRRSEVKTPLAANSLKVK